MYNHKEEGLQQRQKVPSRKNAREAAESGPIKMPERFQLQLARLPSPGIAAVMQASWLWRVYKAVSPSREKRHILLASRRFHKHKITSAF